MTVDTGSRTREESLESFVDALVAERAPLEREHNDE
jgi:hypothetical protein